MAKAKMAGRSADAEPLAHASRANVPVLKSWDEVNERLRELGACEIDISLINAEMNMAIDAAKRQAEESAAQLKAEMSRLKAEIKEFAEYNKAAMEGKSKRMTFGKVGFRQSSGVSYPAKDADTVLRNLKELGMTDCVNVKETINKEALEKYSDERIAGVGACRKVKDNFFIEVAKELVR